MRLRPCIDQPAAVAYDPSRSGTLRLARSSPRGCGPSGQRLLRDVTFSTGKAETTPLGGNVTRSRGAGRQTDRGLRTILIIVGGPGGRAVAAAHEDGGGGDGQKPETEWNHPGRRPADPARCRCCREEASRRLGGEAFQAARDIVAAEASRCVKAFVGAAGAALCRGHRAPRRLAPAKAPRRGNVRTRRSKPRRPTQSRHFDGKMCAPA